MRICHVISEYLPDQSGGTQIHVRDLSRGLRARGHEVSVFCGRRGDGDEYALADYEFEGVAVTTLTNNFADVDRFEMLYANPKIDGRFRGYLERTRPDLVHFHHVSGLSVTMIEVAVDLGIPALMTLHDHWLVCPRGQRIHPETLAICDPLDRTVCLPCLAALWPHLLSATPEQWGPNVSAYRLRRFEDEVRRAFELCSMLIAPSVFHRDRFVEWGVSPERIVAVPHGLSRDGFPENPREPRPVTTIGFIGTALPSKGVHVLIDAFQKLGRADLTLRIHGAMPVFHGDSGYGDRLRARVTAGTDVRFEGAYEQADLPAILADIDILVVPAIWWESFCLTIREGALAGVPVVASDHGAMHEAIAQGIAVGFRPGDSDDLCRVLRELIADDRLRAELGRKAELVRDLDDCVAETVRIYSAIGGSRG